MSYANCHMLIKGYQLRKVLSIPLPSRLRIGIDASVALSEGASMGFRYVCDKINPAPFPAGF